MALFLLGHADLLQIQGYHDPLKGGTIISGILRWGPRYSISLTLRCPYYHIWWCFWRDWVGGGLVGGAADRWKTCQHVRWRPRTGLGVVCPIAPCYTACFSFEAVHQADEIRAEGPGLPMGCCATRKPRCCHCIKTRHCTEHTICCILSKEHNYMSEFSKRLVRVNYANTPAKGASKKGLYNGCQTAYNADYLNEVIPSSCRRDRPGPQSGARAQVFFFNTQNPLQGRSVSKGTV